MKKIYTLVFFCGSLILGQAQTSCFAPFIDFHYYYGNSGYATNIAYADMNNDSKLDAIVGATNIFIMNGNGNGTFAVGAEYSSNGKATREMEVADFNSDNKPDIISFDNPNSGYKSLSIYTNNNYTGISQAVSFPTNIIAGGGSSNPGNIEVADLNADGKKDVVITNYSGNKLYICKNNGNNTLTVIDSLSTDVHPLNIALGDLNGDSKPDIVCTHEYSTSSVSVFLNNGSGTFTAGASLGNVTSYGGVALADFDGDNKLDIIYSNGPYFTYCKGNGNGTFGTGTDIYIASTARELFAGDWNHDTKMDVAWADGSNHSAGSILGNGNGTFQEILGTSTYGNAVDLTIADFDGDNYEDMVTSNGVAHNISFLKGQTDGSFGPLSLHAGASPERFTIGLINGDTIPDIITADYRSNSVSVMLGNGNGSFQSSIHNIAGASLHDVALANLNGDANMDAVAATNSGSISVLLGNGNGTFQTPVFYSATAAGGDQAVALGDVNNDTKTDAVLSSANMDSIYVFLGNGDGTFQSALGYKAGDRPYDVKLALINNDNFLDAVVPNDLSNDVTVLFGTGSGSFLPPLSVPTGAGPRTVAVADLDNDTDRDIVCVNNNGNNISILLNNGNGIFASAVNYAVSNSASPGTVAVGKFDSDNFMDIIVSQYSASNVAVLLNNGNGTFGALSTYQTDYHPQDALLFDFNYDGFTDIASCNEVGSVTVILNSGVSLTAAGSTQLCTGDSVQLSALGGTSYLWSTGATTASIYVNSADTYTCTVTVNGQFGTCIAEAGSIPVTVSSGPPTVGFTPANSDHFCVSDGLLNLSLIGGSPQGGTFSGNYVTNGLFDATSAGLGPHIVTYTITDNCGTASASDTLFIDNEVLASINFQNDTFCTNGGTIVLAPYGTPAGGVWGVGNTVITQVNLSQVPPGNYTLHYATVSGGCKDTAYATIQVINCTGLNELSESTLHVFPNPSNGSFIIEVEEGSEFSTAIIFDLAGKNVFEKNISDQKQIEFNTSLSSGIYLLQLYSKENSVMKKISIE